MLFFTYKLLLKSSRIAATWLPLGQRCFHRYQWCTWPWNHSWETKWHWRRESQRLQGKFDELFMIAHVFSWVFLAVFFLQRFLINVVEILAYQRIETGSSRSQENESFSILYLLGWRDPGGKTPPAVALWGSSNGWSSCWHGNVHCLMARQEVGRCWTWETLTLGYGHMAQDACSSRFFGIRMDKQLLVDKIFLH